MIYLSALSYTAAIMYFVVGINAYTMNKKSELCRIFFVMTLSMTIWSFAWGFIYLAGDVVEYSFWNKISAFGWCTFEAIILYFVMILTRNKFIHYWYVKLLIFLPAGISLYMVLFLFGPGIYTEPLIEKSFYIGNFLYNFTYLLLSILIISYWGYKSSSRIQKRQALIIAFSSFVPFVLNLFVQYILPEIIGYNLPNMGQIFTLVMLWGVNRSIIQYQFMPIPTTLITNKLFQELNGLTFLTDSEGYVIKSNRQAYTLLEYQEEEMIGSHITAIIKHTMVEELVKDCEAIHEPVRLTDILLPSKTGSLIPFNISIVPLHSRSKLLLGLLIIGEDIRATKELYDEIEKHKLTNDRLSNSEKLSRTILEIAPVPIIMTSQKTGLIMYLNTEAQHLFDADKSDLIGFDTVEHFTNTKENDSLIEMLRSEKTITNKEVVIKRKHGSEVRGILTMIPSVYQGEEVSLSCIVDITNQKRIEEALKQRNENINKLNDELVTMNKILMNKSIKDSLTNLYNHQYINEVLERMLQKASQEKIDLCIMMLDIDYFKRVNDQFGHLIGDRVLVIVSELISRNVQKDDYIGRYGGEEFLIILPDTRLETAVNIGESIRSSIADCDLGLKDFRVTLSIGVVQYAGETSNVLINKADLLLYQAKYKGRNRVEIIQEDCLDNPVIGGFVK